MIFAAFALVDGVASLVSGMRGASAKEERWWTLILRGLVGIAAGVLFVLMPLVLVAVWSITTGVFELSAAVRLRKKIKGEWLLALSGALSIPLGIAIPMLATRTME
jgi:uncharacterized membrane protein HdeD (DUF308 family)